jgi:hypothetical protein
MAENESNPYRAAPQDPDEKPRSPIVYFLVETVILLGVTALTLDMGQLFRVAAISVLAQAILILLIALRRTTAPTRMDLIVVKWGLLAWFAIAVITASALGRLNL